MTGAGVVTQCVRRSSHLPAVGMRARPTVLCVDDDPKVVESLARGLYRKGVCPLRAYQGQHGYWLACTRQPSAIVLDLQMPLENGEDVVSYLRSNALTRHIPIVIVSGYVDDAAERRLESLGVDSVLRKPSSVDKIWQTVSDLI